jgi:hypothetical protein
VGCRADALHRLVDQALGLLDDSLGQRHN